MAGNQNNPWSFASPFGSGMLEAEVVNINSPDNSVQVRIHGYQDDQGGIPDSGLQWVKVLGASAGIMGATSTHNLYPGAKVMLGASGQQFFVVGSVTGYDSDSSKDATGADSSDNTDPNTPRQVRGSQGPDNRTIPAGQGSDQTSKATRNVTKTDSQYQTEQPEKVYDYTKGTAPYDKGKPAKFPDLKSIGIDKLIQGSNVLDTIDQLDGNISGAIKASTKIIRSMEQGGFGSADSVMNSGGAADAGVAQVAQSFSNIQLQDLLQALVALLAAYNLVQGANSNSTTEQLSSVPNSLQYQTFNVDQATQTAVFNDVQNVDPSTGAALVAVISALKSDFQSGFNQAVANAVAYIATLVSQHGVGALVVGTGGSAAQLQQLIGTIQSVASAAGMGASNLAAIGGGALTQALQGGTQAVQSLIQSVQGQAGQIQSMMQALNVFGGEPNAVAEIMGGGASTQESLTGITMKFVKKITNFDAKGFLGNATG